MPIFSTPKSPSLAQRLGDRRRALALIGLAAAAVLGARAARRRGAAPAREYQSAPVAPTPPAPPTSPPSPASPVPPEPEPIEASAGGPIAAVDVDPPEPDEDPEPNTEELAAAEIAVLAILTQEGRLETDRTGLAVATTLERETVEVAALLRKLKQQGHVAGEEYTATGERIWNVTPAGAARLD